MEKCIIFVAVSPKTVVLQKKKTKKSVHLIPWDRPRYLLRNYCIDFPCIFFLFFFKYIFDRGSF